MRRKHVPPSRNDEAGSGSLPAGAHSDAAAAFVDRVRARHGEDLVELYVLGSTVRGEASGRSSDVDALPSRTHELVADMESLCTSAD